MKIFICLVLSFISLSLFAQENLKIEEVKVYKTLHRMDLIANGKVVKSYRVMLGKGGNKPKRKEGDYLVPEGDYILDYKNDNSKFYKSIHVSYPNEEDKRRANEAGVEPGGDIMIHGLPNKKNVFFKLIQKLGILKSFDWTAGCTAVNDKEMDEIFEKLDIYTPIKFIH